MSWLKLTTADGRERYLLGSEIAGLSTIREEDDLGPGKAVLWLKGHSEPIYVQETVESVLRVLQGGKSNPALSQLCRSRVQQYARAAPPEQPDAAYVLAEAVLLWHEETGGVWW